LKSDTTYLCEIILLRCLFNNLKYGGCGCVMSLLYSHIQVDSCKFDKCWCDSDSKTSSGGMVDVFFFVNVIILFSFFLVYY
jgi:hypothetical protein